MKLLVIITGILLALLAIGATCGEADEFNPIRAIPTSTPYTYHTPEATGYGEGKVVFP